MKRKTNLFYTKGIDSKFITFSNYTESLTGNFLSTDTKLYPSRFIALYIKGLNEDTKPALIKYLAAYYESKLAVIRDYYSNNRGDVEKDVNPLGYLLDALLRIKGFKEVEPDSESSYEESEVKYEVDYEYSIVDNPIVQFKYISEITEQDYNGTYADTICCIDLKKYANIVDVVKNTDVNDNVAQFDRPITLYGWDDIPEEYADVKTIPDSIAGLNLDEYVSITNQLDDSQTYEINNDLSNVININEIIPELNKSVSDVIKEIEPYKTKKSVPDILDEILHKPINTEILAFQNFVNEKLAEQTEQQIVIFYDNDENMIKDNTIYSYDGSSINTIDLTKDNEYHITSEVKELTLDLMTSSVNNDSLEFNCIIPLYDIVNINYKSNFSTIERLIEQGNNTIDLTPSDSNIMYITNVPLGMWFYTNGEVNEENSTSIKLYYDAESGFSQSWSLTISSQFKPFPYSSKMPTDMLTNSDTNAYSTFAQVLASQASMVNKFIEVMTQIGNLENHIRNMESQLTNIGTSYNIDNIHREFNNFEIEMNNKFNSLKDDVLEQISYLKWHTTV